MRAVNLMGRVASIDADRSCKIPLAPSVCNQCQHCSRISGGSIERCSRNRMTRYLQTTAAECGLACIGFIASHHGRAHNMNELRAKYAVSLRGMSLADLAKLASRLGLRARALQLELDEIPKLTTPCVLHWNLNHYVVLLRCHRGHLVLHDPARGERRLALSAARPPFTGTPL